MVAPRDVTALLPAAASGQRPGAESRPPHRFSPRTALGGCRRRAFPVGRFCGVTEVRKLGEQRPPRRVVIGCCWAHATGTDEDALPGASGRRPATPGVEDGEDRETDGHPHRGLHGRPGTSERKRELGSLVNSLKWDLSFETGVRKSGVHQTL